MPDKPLESDADYRQLLLDLADRFDRFEEVVVSQLDALGQQLKELDARIESFEEMNLE